MFGVWKPGWIARALVWPLRLTSRGRTQEVRVARAASAFGLIVAALLMVCTGACPAVARAMAPASPRTETLAPAASYFSATPQLTPLRPFAHLPPNATARIHAAVVTAPDPLETRLGRSFDMALAAMIAAFQARGYVLDGFALAWGLRDASSTASPRGAPAKSDPEAAAPDLHRYVPSVMLFRKDGWREGEGVEYYAVFLVGDSQTFGVEPVAFDRAARCVLLLNGIGREELQRVRERDCDTAGAMPLRGRLDLIGPSFSGSMQSVAVALGNLCAGPCGDGVQVRLLSPSASVGSNDRIVRHPFLSPAPGAQASVVYRSLAENLTGQITGLLSHLCENGHMPVENVTILAEESTFGQEALQLQRTDELKRACGDTLEISARQFPQNIASIRAEHSQLRNAQRDKAEAALALKGRLLELDMSGAEVSWERPTVYQPGLTSRSDELMLYRSFDTMKLYRKPDVVVIVATDIRDRLFLLGEVRKALPGTLPVMVELDFLAVHPDYRKVSRGAVVLAAGDPVVCLDADARLTACRPAPKPQAQAQETGEEHGCPWPQRRKDDKPKPASERRVRFPFATDYAANAFRAIVLLDEYGSQRMPFGEFVDMRLPSSDLKQDPVAYVATMAGYQGLGDSARAQRSLVAVGDVRLAMQEPAYLALFLGGLLFVAMAVCIWQGSDRGKVVLPCLRGLVYDFRAASAGMWWRTRHRRRAEPAAMKPNPAAVASLVPACRRAYLALMMALGVAVLAIAAYRGLYLIVSSREGVPKSPCFFMLAHGRDGFALACIWMLYAALCIVAYMRLNVSNRRYAIYNAAFARNSRRTSRGTRVITGISWAVPVICGLATMGMIQSIHGRAVSVDRNEVWWMAAIVMATGLAFVVNLFWQMRLLGNLSLSLTRTIAPVQARRGIADWPRPCAIRESPQTPFNLTLREYRRDMPALLRNSPRIWAAQTLQVMTDGGEGMNPWQFERWTEQLVAELKLCVVTLRTCAWCAMLAPVSVLIAMSVYPPAYERLLTSIAIMLLLLSFAATILVVLRLEKDAMLGLMFTNDGNTLTFGGALRALWPKFVAMGLILVPLAAPDVWSWMYGLVRSINSFG